MGGTVGEALLVGVVGAVGVVRGEGVWAILDLEGAVNIEWDWGQCGRSTEGGGGGEGAVRRFGHALEAFKNFSKTRKGKPLNTS